MNTTHDNGQPADGDTVARFREQLRRDVIAKAARLRGELARDELRRWENFAAAVLRVAASARLLRDIAECSRVASFTGHDNSHALQAGRYVEQTMATAIADLIGVDVLATIADALEPTPEVDRRPIVIHAGDPVYTLPAGWAIRQLDARPAFHLTDDEALEAFEALAFNRLMEKARCLVVGRKWSCACQACKRGERWGDADDGDPCRRVEQIAKRWARFAAKARRAGGAT